MPADYRRETTYDRNRVSRKNPPEIVQLNDELDELHARLDWAFQDGDEDAQVEIEDLIHQRERDIRAALRRA